MILNILIRGDKMSKVVVIHSGGLDSTVLLAKCKREFDEVIALNFNYGSKHNERERRAAVEVCNALGIKQVQINLPFINELFKSDLLQSGGEIPQGHYSDDSMKSTVVPFRNGIMLSIAVGYAESIGAEKVLLGSHKGDRSQYPDCREEFTKVISEAAQLGTYTKVVIESPFNNLMKYDVVKIGLEINAPLYLSWSCYEGKERPCLKCGTCTERTEAFVLNNSKDPLLTLGEWVAAVEFWKNVEKDKN
jgi:7-cyano-7-deazaguanine synthase